MLPQHVSQMSIRHLDLLESLIAFGLKGTKFQDVEVVAHILENK